MSEYKVLHVDSDSFGDFCVLDDGNYRVLSFGDNDEQSKLDKSQPFVPQHTYVQAMLSVLLFTQPKSVIILGLGGGALVHSLRHVDAAIKITAVELRQRVIEVAKKFFQLPLSKKLTLINQDANLFLAQAEHKKVDVIFADIYSNKGVDKQQLTDLFINQSKQLIKADGFLVLNCWKEHSRDRHLRDTLYSHFTHVYACLTGGGNWVIYATNGSNTFGQANNKQALQHLSQKLDTNISRVLTRFGVWE
ncbi:fused MFS/spermidine synthase [Shewanella inventionis]|uniref:Spermidine synthase n=1 Tax=Shewanella inventionis TaxID=1738770 RepID=A0ABQ1IXG9_9GAMM|nr:fused MFS/spermidine synthase [Shewanella inventionis]MCL1157011.1 fused MFS/spermidine synthase [Shewanella inventionis]UAL43173.1 fused MFS/spermidine synthase [Shewanella inventionis]GGB54532.1 spermidine synthase [Shewanella inventionis]